MPDEAPQGYPVAVRAMAVVGLLVAGALAFILLDVISGGRLAALTDCRDCQDKEAAGA